jgi:hypothetical protein
MEARTLWPQVNEIGLANTSQRREISSQLKLGSGNPSVDDLAGELVNLRYSLTLVTQIYSGCLFEKSYETLPIREGLILIIKL